MMDASVCKAFVALHLTPLCRFLSIAHWTITVEYGRCSNPDWAAACARRTKYCAADITIDHDQFADTDFLLDSLFHELTHIVLADFDLYRDWTTQFCTPDSVSDRQESIVWHHCVEQAVEAMSRVWRLHLRATYLETFAPQPEARNETDAHPA